MITLIQGARVVNEGRVEVADVMIEGDRILSVGASLQSSGIWGADMGGIQTPRVDIVVDGRGMLLLPGLIDDQVHFREPGLTHKADIASESRAAVAGGITSFMEMPNTVPQATTQDELQKKYDRAAEVSPANYSFFMGATNSNLEDVLKTDPRNVCGVKVFMGSSTGDMLVDNEVTLEGLFKECPMLIASHCEDEPMIQAGMAAARAKYGEDVPIEQHPLIRSAEACYKSSSMAAELAAKTGARLHILHISTARELSIFDGSKPLKDKRITAEACVHHLWFTDADYAKRGSRIKWNPAVKTTEDRAALREALSDGRIDVLATDHAPHTAQEKAGTYFNAPSGGPLVQHALPALLEGVREGWLALTDIPRLTAHRVAELFDIQDRGYIRPGYKADLVLVNPDSAWTVSKENILYKCAWSPFEGDEFQARVVGTWVNGVHVYDGKTVADIAAGERLTFER
jgi:dihydroorotase